MKEKFPSLTDYPFHVPAIRETNRVVFSSPVTYFVGENGSGKSTLLRAVAQAAGYYIWTGIQRARYSASEWEDDLGGFLKLEWTGEPVKGSFFASEIFRNFSTVLDEWAVASPGVLDYFGGKSLLSQSHGQSHLSFFKSRFRIKGLYFLDEPENALSPAHQIELLGILRDTAFQGTAQYIISTHSPLLMALPDAVIYTFDRGALQEIGYRETDHYRLYHDFLNDPGLFLNMGPSKNS